MFVSHPIAREVERENEKNNNNSTKEKNRHILIPSKIDLFRYAVCSRPDARWRWKPIHAVSGSRRECEEGEKSILQQNVYCSDGVLNLAQI